MVSVPSVGVHVTLKAVIGVPPFDFGAVNFTVTSAFPAVKDVIAGWLGTAQVVILFEGFDGLLVNPLALVAVTVNV